MLDDLIARVEVRSRFVRRAPTVLYAPMPDGQQVAYQVVGDGPVDLLYASGIPSHLELVWDFAELARLFEALASFTRLILFDQRGGGLSDPAPANRTALGLADDMVTVLDAVGTSQAALFAVSHAGPAAVRLVASRPDRFPFLILDS